MAKQFHVDFRRKKPEESGLGTRSKISGSIGQALQGAQSETAVQMYLAQKYPGNVITIMALEWK
jgi:hypothetical protein